MTVASIFVCTVFPPFYAVFGMKETHSKNRVKRGDRVKWGQHFLSQNQHVCIPHTLGRYNFCQYITCMLITYQKYLKTCYNIVWAPKIMFQHQFSSKIPFFLKIAEKRDEKYFVKKPRNWGAPRIMGARKMGGVLYCMIGK